MKHFSKGLFVGAVIGALTIAAPLSHAATPRDQLVIGTSLAQVLSLDPHQATEGKAVEIMSNLAVIAHMCDRVLIMKNGVFVDELTKADLQAGITHDAYARELFEASFMEA
ncbi:ABC-type microcin C transport system duplicated ATPase subunit YejF [Rhizobium binae]|uniref:ABC-type microcin C transport system duplicated ATPase subunit YejF n=1 Tax=Rhizobium binae TaxID=1138190 RepID=A0ABV2MDT5_9HYPH|nr:hypothetical protein [Rhizobium binae]NKL49359.1 hypothetical protein [Rhizobium leguminosarum bv. viciae]MBX4941243.1 hypothetical protein [Rhizobium binae]MBX4943542.1 hypothetical protein [Rhizobium binae]MBX4961299.1 hypothetical protein [Rhizobium binae]